MGLLLGEHVRAVVCVVSRQWVAMSECGCVYKTCLIQVHLQGLQGEDGARQMPDSGEL